MATQIMWLAYIVTAVAADMFLDVQATPEDLLDYETFGLASGVENRNLSFASALLW